jgi:uncharacterized membrane protein
MLAWVIGIPLLGGMTGLRSMTPMAVLCWFAYHGYLDVGDTWAMWTTRGISVIVFSVLAIGELIGDKLPKCPNRTDPFALIARLAFGGLAGAIGATALQGSAMEGVVLGSISALAATFVSFHIRQHVVRISGLPDFAAAIVEDASAVGLSVIAVVLIVANN